MLHNYAEAVKAVHNKSGIAVKTTWKDGHTVYYFFEDFENDPGYDRAVKQINELWKFEKLTRSEFIYKDNRSFKAVMAGDTVKIHIFNWNGWNEIKTNNSDKIFTVYKNNGVAGVDWNPGEFTPIDHFSQLTVYFEIV